MISSKIHFCLMGPGKAGSTWLYSYLASHPEFCPPSIKETEFFSKHYAKGKDWYQRFFVKEGEFKAYGDFSNQNYRYEQAFENALAYDPDTRFVYLYREPKERLVSALKFERMNGSDISAEDYIKQWPIDLLDDAAMYKTFQDSDYSAQVLWINFLDIVNEPDSVKGLVCQHIGLSEWTFSDSFYNPSLVPTSAPFVRFGKSIALLLRELGLFTLLQTLKNSQLVRKMFYSKQTLEITIEEKKLLNEHVKRFEALKVPSGPLSALQ